MYDLGPQVRAQEVEAPEFAGEVGLRGDEGLEARGDGCVAGVEGREGDADGG
jgi:hypothetical protein